jgi:hypothetical protein
MSYRTVILFVVGVALTSVHGAPALKQKDPGYYYLTTVGDRWTMRTGAVDQTFSITRVEKKDGALIVDVGIVQDGRDQLIQQMRISEDGVFRLSMATTTYQTPECLLMLPYRQGQEWEFDLGDGNGGHSKLTAVRRESVDTPAGQFDAIRVERTGGNAATYWFAEGVGLVKVAFGKSGSVIVSVERSKKN